MSAGTSKRTTSRYVLKHMLCNRRKTFKFCILFVLLAVCTLYVIRSQLNLADVPRNSTKLGATNSSQNLYPAASTTVIVAEALDCVREEFENFIVPLRRVYDGDIVLFVTDNTQDDVNKCCNENNVTRMPLQTGNRYAGYSDVCKQYEWCFATDIRGAFFQVDPFKNIITGYDLIFAAEDSSLTIGNCPYNSEWIKTCWGTEKLNQFSKYNIVSSGAIMGTPKGFAELNAKMLIEKSKTAKQCECTARDQGHLNYLVHSGSIEVPYTIQKREEGVVNAVGVSRNVSMSQLNSDGYTLNKDGSVSPVIYRYDPYTAVTELKVIAYSLYGNNPLYTVSAILNSKLVREIYPGWIMRVYYDKVPTWILDRLRSAKVELVDMAESKIKSRMSWRFLVASDENIDRYLIRDIDSRPNEREKAAVYEWIASRKKFHVMRDNKFHGHTMNGGMWGGTRDAVPNMKTLLLERQHMNDDYMQDMNFLSDKIWPIAQKSVLQHDRHTCYKYGASSFPTSLIGKGYVGHSCKWEIQWNCSTFCNSGICDPDT